MFTMEPRTDVIRFEHDGKMYVMTADEIEAAYRYQERQYRLSDAERQFNLFALGADPDSLDDDELHDAISSFEKVNGIGYEEAMGLLEAFADRYEDNFDCNVDENTAWENAVREVLEEYAGN